MQRKKKIQISFVMKEEEHQLSIDRLGASQILNLLQKIYLNETPL